MQAGHAIGDSAVYVYADLGYCCTFILSLGDPTLVSWDPMIVQRLIAVLSLQLRRVHSAQSYLMQHCGHEPVSY